jgi:hypothetical protein
MENEFSQHFYYTPPQTSKATTAAATRDAQGKQRSNVGGKA